ncbi:Hypothetical protein PHPALM_12106 [Phytophthora palmivora]|uniref:Uncharacterized protein n=1 Tax=Phytophthora palmivora TaxID=4796 RepID=A0A2P4Y0J7_9STRA|nr:Hypothetical protein PHPALM_12106 [Phytophthora palmivora]
MLYDRDLADQLALLRLPDTAVLEDTEPKLAKGRRMLDSTDSGRRGARHSSPLHRRRPEQCKRYEQRLMPVSLNWTLADELHQIYVAAFAGRDSQEKSRSTRRNDRSLTLVRCPHRRSSKLDDLGCWKRLTCQKCNWKGHPSEHCVFVCRACGDIHEVGKYPMEVVRPHETRWDAARRRGEDVKLERSPGWNLVRAERSKLWIYAYVEKKAGSKVSKRKNRHTIHLKCMGNTPRRLRVCERMSMPAEM